MNIFSGTVLVLCLLGLAAAQRAESPVSEDDTSLEHSDELHEDDIPEDHGDELPEDHDHDLPPPEEDTPPAKKKETVPPTKVEKPAPVVDELTDEDRKAGRIRPSVVRVAARKANAEAKRQLAGGWVRREHDKAVQDAVDFATFELSKKSNSLFHDKPIEIITARSQVVSGTKFDITYRIGRTTCKKNEVKIEDLESCELDDNHPLSLCTAVIWSQPWLNKREILSSKCTEERKETGPVIPDDVYEIRRNKVLSHQKKLFSSFQLHYKKVYATNEETAIRFKIFQNNMKRIDLLNQHEQATAKYGVTEHADLTPKEFSRKFLGLKPSLAKKSYKHGAPANITRVSDLPTDFDWRTKGAVTEVKNQASCGSCWAFSTTGNVEGQWFLKKLQLVSLSEQELVDCDKLDQGCNGGLPSNAYEQIEELGGLEQESDYPYEGTDDKCSFDKQLAKVTISGWVNVSSDETEMANFLYQHGPLSIGINANAMQFYFGGISHPPKFLCNPNNLDHGVLIVGYGVHTSSLFKKKTPFWIVKNSWGASWGEKGYYRVYRGGGACGLNQMVTSSVV